MIRIQNRVFWLCLTGTVFLAAGMIFLPRYFSRSLDLRSQNQVRSAKREDFAFLESSPNGFLENARAFRYLREEDCLTLVASLNETSRMNSELLEQVYDQVMVASELGMLPWLGARGYEFALQEGIEAVALDYWGDKATLAQYYNLTFPSDSGLNTKEMLNFWYLNFSDGKNFSYSFVVNAATYQIYYAEIYNSYTDHAVQKYEGDRYMTGVSDTMSEKERLEYEKWQKAATGGGVVVDGAIYDAESAVWGYGYEYEAERFALGCMNYYEAEYTKTIQQQNLHDKLALAVLNYGNSSVYMEQLPKEPADPLPYRGISVGLQNLGDDIEKTIKE